MISYSKSFEDVLLNRVFGSVDKGFYVDVGAGHPTVDSTTRHFYDRGWRGINVEPGSMFAALARHRPRDINLHLAASGDSCAATFYEHPTAIGTSTLSPRLADTVQELDRNRVAYEVEVQPLHAILAEHAPECIDFMSVDVAGHEEQVLRGNDWKRFRPRVLVVQATLPNTNVPCHQSWEPILLEADYDFVYFDGVNRFYLRREDAQLKACFDRPVNVMDKFVRAETEQLRELTARSQQSLAARAEESAAAEQELDALRRTVESLQAEFAESQQSLAERTAELAASQDELAVSDETLAARTEQLVVYQDKCETCEEQLASLQGELETVRSEFARCEAERVSRTQEAATLHQEIAKRDAVLAARAEQLSMREGEFARSEQTLAARDQQLAELQAKLEDGDAALTARTEELTALQEQCARLEQQMAEPGEPQGESSGERNGDSLQEALALREEELQTLREEVARCTSQLESLEGNLSRRAQEVQWLRGEVENRENHYHWITRRTGPRSLATGLKVARKIHWLTRM